MGRFFAISTLNHKKVVGKRRAKNRTQDARTFFASSAAVLFRGIRSDDGAAKITPIFGRDGCREIHRGMILIKKYLYFREIKIS
ncbi:MAG: hypothetical protein KH334_02215 [Clostridiales bacterium]|nr:hypothetical protein [Clostridiales bacterium]